VRWIWAQRSDALGSKTCHNERQRGNPMQTTPSLKEVATLAFVMTAEKLIFSESHPTASIHAWPDIAGIIII
jgi:hypothetical protein